MAPDLVRVSSRDDAYDLAFMDEMKLLEHLFGHVDELVCVAEALAEDWVNAPEEHAAADDVFEGGEDVDGWVGDGIWRAGVLWSRSR